MKRTGRTWDQFLADYLARISPEERAMFDEASAFFVEENRRIEEQRKEN